MARTIAFVFPGQGSQRAGMVEAMPQLEGIDRLLDAAEALTDVDLRSLSAMGSAEDLADTRVAQPLLYLSDWAWGTALLEAGIAPHAAAGHSLGEFAALAVAGVFSVEAGLELVAERSKLMATVAASAAGGMAAVLGMESDTVRDAIEGISGVWVANDNAPGQIVISGTHTGIESATRGLAEAGARKIVPLKVAGPFHSPLMEPASDAFAQVLDQTSFSEPAWPVLQNTAPTPSTDPAEIRSRLATQITEPVRWTDTMHALRSMGVDTVVEAGPGAVLKGLFRRAGGMEALAVEDGGLDAIIDAVGT